MQEWRISRKLESGAHGGRSRFSDQVVSAGSCANEDVISVVALATIDQQRNSSIVSVMSGAGLSVSVAAFAHAD